VGPVTDAFTEAYERGFQDGRDAEMAALLTEFSFDNLSAAFTFVGRLHAIRCALAYDLSDLPFPQKLDAAGSRLWRANMAAWKATAL
jgi:hypothetical protein